MPHPDATIRVIRYKNFVDVHMRIPTAAWLIWGRIQRIKRRLVPHIDAAKDICINED
jgi:hypothetical protein